MNKVKAIAAILLLAVSIGCARHREVKRTGRCAFAYSTDVRRYWFLRPNGELFEMYFDNPPVVLKGLPPGRLIEWIEYTDSSRDQRHFIKAKLAQ